MSPLYAKLQEIDGPWSNLSSSKLKNILQLSCCILSSRSCNLQKCRDELSAITGKGDLKQETAYARLKRVFQTGVITPVLKTLFLLVLHLVKPDENCLLILDRTEFSVGKRWVNLLVIGLEWHGVFVPLVWKDLGKRRLSRQQERIDLLDRLLAWWKASRVALPILCLTGDREFTGQHWIMALDTRNINYVIRIKSNLRFPVWFSGQLKDRYIQLKVLARYMDKTVQPSMEVVVQGTLITNIVKLPQENPKDKEDFILLITNLQDKEQCQTIFRRRWPIECCFKHMKSNGFDLEELNLEGQHKVELLFGILSFVYVLAIRQGIINQYEDVVPIKQYAGGKAYRQQSLFRFGLFHLKKIVKELKHLMTHLIKLIIEINPPIKCKKLIFKKSVVQL